MINYKRIMATALAATMVMGSSTVAFAADKEASGSGEGETQYVKVNDIFDVVFPTVADSATTFDYLLDPEGLIAKTNGDRYNGKTFEDDKTVYFLRTDSDKTTDYESSSDVIKVVNKSTDDVDLKVSAKVVDVPTGIQMAASSTFAGTDTELYLGLKGTDGTTPTEKAITADGVDLTASIAADTAAYEVKWNATTGQYEKALTTAASAADYSGFKSYSFQLTGACNTAEGTDWSGLTDNAPKVDLTWSVKDFTVTGPQVNVSNTGLITMTGFTAEKNYKSSTLTNDNGTFDINAAPVDWNLDQYDETNGGSITGQLGTAWMDSLRGKSGTLVVTLSNDETITTVFPISE